MLLENVIISLKRRKYSILRRKLRPVEYVGYREYNSNTGRWTGRDPIGENGGLNLNSFLCNSTVSYVDNLGLIFGFVDDWMKGQLDPIFNNIKSSIDSASSNTKDFLNSFLKTTFDNSIGLTGTSTWGANIPRVNTRVFEFSWSGSLNITGFKKPESCLECVQIYGTIGGTVIGKIPLGNPIVNITLGGNVSAQITWERCKRNGNVTIEGKFAYLNLVITPRIGLRIGDVVKMPGSDTGVGLYVEGGGWMAWSKDLTLPDENAIVNYGWYASGNATIGILEKRITFSGGGSPNF